MKLESERALAPNGIAHSLNALAASRGEIDFRMFLPRASGQDVTNPIFLESQLMQSLGAHLTGLGAPNQIDSVRHCRFFSPDVLAQDAID